MVTYYFRWTKYILYQVGLFLGFYVFLISSEASEYQFKLDTILQNLPKMKQPNLSVSSYHLATASVLPLLSDSDLTLAFHKQSSSSPNPVSTRSVLLIFFISMYFFRRNRITTLVLSILFAF